MESTSSVFLFLVSPIAKHSFLLKAIQALYLKKLKAKNNVFVYKKEDEDDDGLKLQKVPEADIVDDA